MTVNIEVITIALLQMNSSADLDENLQFVSEQLLVKDQQKIELLLLPENFAQLARRTREQYVEPAGRGKLKTFLSELAEEHSTYIVAGSIPTESEKVGRVYARCMVFDPSGQELAHYDKVHLFDVELADGQTYKESDYYLAGEANADAANIEIVDINIAKLGLSICYDLRFPELYRKLSQQGANILCVPSAFTDFTGKAHWETLLRARAIENQCYVLAAAQVGKHANDRKTYGHSMIVDPWGEVVAKLEDQPGLLTASIELNHLTEIRNRFPALSQRRL